MSLSSFLPSCSSPPFLIFPVFTVQFVQNIASRNDTDDVLFFDDRNDFQVFGNHDAGDLFDIGIGCSNDDVFGHHVPGRACQEFLKALVVFADAVVIDAGAEQIDVVRNMGLYLFVQ